ERACGFDYGRDEGLSIIASVDRLSKGVRCALRPGHRGQIRGRVAQNITRGEHPAVFEVFPSLLHLSPFEQELIEVLEAGVRRECGDDLARDLLDVHVTPPAFAMPCRPSSGTCGWRKPNGVRPGRR